jgi:hypothetical protein
MILSGFPSLGAEGPFHLFLNLLSFTLPLEKFEKRKVVACK